VLQSVAERCRALCVFGAYRCRALLQERFGPFSMKDRVCFQKMQGSFAGMIGSFAGKTQFFYKKNRAHFQERYGFFAYCACLHAHISACNNTWIHGCLHHQPFELASCVNVSKYD